MNDYAQAARRATVGKGLSIVLSIGRWGGFYVAWGWSKRLCLGWIAITVLPVEIDDLLKDQKDQSL